MAKRNPEGFIAFIIENCVVRVSIGRLRNCADELKSSDAEMSNILNKYFAGVFPYEDMNNIPGIELSEGVQALENIPFFPDEVEKQRGKLNICKSTGPDGLHPRILRNIFEIISSSLTEVFNRSIKTVIIPDDWKPANVTAIFKYGSCQETWIE